jgi:MYXO-CTERM domain-containing protein
MSTGSQSTGSQSTGSQSGSGGNGGNGGAAATSSGSSSGDVYPQGGGCSCRTDGRSDPSDAAWAVALGALFVARSRRRGARC